MQTIVVTGASGFLASHIINQLSAIDCQVTPVSRKKASGAIQIDDYIDTPKADMLVHLAEDSNRIRVNKIGKRYIKYSSNVMTALVEKFNGHVIYASSATVYGDKGKVPYTVDSPTYITDAYSESKITNEKIVLESGGVVLRLSNVYGNGMSPNNVMSDIVKQLQDDKIVVNDATPVKDFISVTDVAKLVGVIVQSNFNGIVNVGSGVPVSIFQLIEAFLNVNRHAIKEISSRNKSEKTSINVLDISNTKKIFNWAPSGSLEKNLHTLLSIKQNYI